MVMRVCSYEGWGAISGLFSGSLFLFIFEAESLIGLYLALESACVCFLSSGITSACCQAYLVFVPVYMAQDFMLMQQALCQLNHLSNISPSFETGSHCVAQAGLHWSSSCLSFLSVGLQRVPPGLLCMSSTFNNFGLSVPYMYALFRGITKNLLIFLIH